MARCENCKDEKNGTEIEGHFLCGDCMEDIIRCDFCDTFLGISYDALMADNFGKLTVPELSLPDQMTNLIFCNIECLETYLKKYKEGIAGRTCCGIGYDLRLRRQNG